MTPLLQEAVTAMSALPAADQDFLATRLLDELASEDAFDQALAESGGRLSGLAAEALAEYREGRTLPLDPEAL